MASVPSSLPYDHMEHSHLNTEKKTTNLLFLWTKKKVFAWKELTESLIRHWKRYLHTLILLNDINKHFSLFLEKNFTRFMILNSYVVCTVWITWYKIECILNVKNDYGVQFLLRKKNDEKTFLNHMIHFLYLKTYKKKTLPYLPYLLHGHGW